MTPKQKKQELSAIILEQLDQLLKKKVALYYLPYYQNIGDTFIWEGEKNALSILKRQCIRHAGWQYMPATPLPMDTTLLITGDGFFGDTWRDSFDLIIKELAIHSRKQQIVFLPNFVYYSDRDLLSKDIAFFSEFENLTICGRDEYSYNFLQKHFRNNSVLMPDMAFCMDENTLRKHAERKPTQESLYFKRLDKEAVLNTFDSDSNMPSHDWLTVEDEDKYMTNFYRLLSRAQLLHHYHPKLGLKCIDLLYDKMHRPQLTKIGLKQLADYKKIYATRLHAMIAGCMLEREIEFIDNSYGKLGNYYRTWLHDCDNVKEYQSIHTQQSQQHNTL